MAEITINELKARFQSSDRPSQKDFNDFIDTLVARIDAISVTGSWSPGDAFFYATGTLTGSTYVATYSPAVSTYGDGALLVFKADVENPSGGTNFNAGGGAHPIVKQKGLPLKRGDIQPAQMVEVRFDAGASVFQVVSALSRGNLKTGDIVTSASTLDAAADRLLCDGTEKLVVDFPDLAALLGSTYGVPSDGDHFVLPNYKSRFPLGAGGTLPISGSPVNLAGVGGEEKHILTAAELPSDLDGHVHLLASSVQGSGPLLSSSTQMSRHSHSSGSDSNDYNLEGVADPADVGLSGPAQDGTGTDTPHNTMPPWIGAYYYILT